MKKSLLLICTASVLFSCKEDTTPAWLEIPSIELTTDEPVEGSDSHGITDAWVYMDGTALGVFELPAKIPVLAEGEHNFLIYAGIKNNGISATRIKYPFYDRYEVTLNLVKGEKITVNPVVNYKSNLTFELIEDFEDTGIDFSAALISDTPMVFVDKTDYPEIVKYGQRCGGIFLTETDSIFKAATATYLDLPKSEDVFMELDFLNNNSIRMGVIAQNTTDYSEHTPLVQMNPQSESSWVWKKIYIDLKEDVSYEIYATSYELYLLSVLDPENTLGKIYLDNIKVIRYQ
ncbi:MAG: hypothetical protein HYZ14_10575 [Bacteroidetes bacterium]|nr:hypothetical protein [Bacteroidota bacterium]